MNNYVKGGLSLLLLTVLQQGYTHTNSTQRISQIDNQQVKVWQTTVYPSKNQALTMHRHDLNRVVVALTDGRLKITNDKGVTHYWNLKKNKAYYVTKDVPNELHSDENLSNHPIKVMVIEIK